MPPSTAPTRKAARTQTTGTARWRASPPATPPMIGCCVSRTARRTSRCSSRGTSCAGREAVMVSPSSQSDPAPDHEEEPRPTPDSDRRRTSGDQGSPRWCTAPRGSTVVTMSTTPPDTQPPPTPGPDSGPRVGWDEIRDLAGIRRTVGDRRRVAGVAGGLARHLDIDPLIVRVAFVVLTFFGGAGLVLYIACWLLVPEEGSDWARVALDRRSRTVALVLVGALVVVILAGHTWWGSGYPWGLLIVAGIIALLATAVPRRARGAAQADAATDPAAATVAPGDTRTYAVPPSYVEQPRPVNPRKKGPILFWFALAVMAVGLGVLGVVDLAGASVAPSAYPALVLALSGAFLLLGAFWGRAGGLILVGLVAAAATVGATIGDQWDPHREVVRPVSSATVPDTYHLDTGNLVVDLTDVRDPQELD